MKRISLLSVTVLLISCLSAKADDYDCYVPLRYQVRWSPYSQSLISGPIHYNPYVLNYKSNGLVSDFLEYSPYALGYNKNALICDTLHYSPYAFGYGRSGLVDRCVRYSPYAFGYGKSGLVSEASYGYCCGTRYASPVSPLSIFIQVTPSTQYTQDYQAETFQEYANRVNAEAYEARSAILEKQRARMKAVEKQEVENPSQAISQFLNSKNIPFRTNWSLRMDGKTISVNFDIEDANMIIKFWDSKEIAQLAQEGGYREKHYENYFQSWKEHCLTKIGTTKKVYNIVADTKEEVLNQLGASDNLTSDEKVYASAQTSSTIAVDP